MRYEDPSRGFEEKKRIWRAITQFASGAAHFPLIGTFPLCFCWRVSSLCGSLFLWRSNLFMDEEFFCVGRN